MSTQETENQVGGAEPSTTTTEAVVAQNQEAAQSGDTEGNGVNGESEAATPAPTVVGTFTGAAVAGEA